MDTFSIIKQNVFKLRYWFLLVYCCSFGQNWISTEFTPFDAFAISDVESHNSNLYATYATGLGNVLGKSENDGVTWEAINLDGITGFPTLLVSTGDRLYLATVNIVDSFLYYSTDDGETFTQDMNGLPSGILGGAPLMNRLQFIDNRIVVGMGGAGYYQKSILTPTDAFVQFDTPTGLNSGSDRLVFFNGSLYTYDNAGAFIFYKSTDFGSNWTLPSSNGLPPNLNSEILEVNPITGRLYLSGTFDSSSQYGLFFSDDQGISWSQFDLSMVSSTNYLGDFHRVTALYANGPIFFAGLDNDIAGSHPDVISTSNLGTMSPAVDVEGLPEDAPGNVFGNKIIVHNNKPVIALNIIDIYIKDQTLSTNDYSLNEYLKVYPTVVNDFITIESLTPYKADIYDNSGKLTMKIESQENKEFFNLNLLSSGIYYIVISGQNGLRSTKKFLKTN